MSLSFSRLRIDQDTLLAQSGVQVYLKSYIEVWSTPLLLSDQKFLTISYYDYMVPREPLIISSVNTPKRILKATPLRVKAQDVSPPMEDLIPPILLFVCAH